jgi:hypothetical protein
MTDQAVERDRLQKTAESTGRQEKIKGTTPGGSSVLRVSIVIPCLIDPVTHRISK